MGCEITSKASAAEVPVPQSREQARALIEHNPRVLRLSDARSVAQEMGSTRKDTDTSDVMVPAEILLERLNKEQVDALTQAAPHCGIALGVNSSDGRAKCVMSGSPASLREVAALLGKAGFPSLAHALSCTLAVYQRRDFTLRLRGRAFDLSQKTLVMGILNVTPDSFSDGGRYLEHAAAVERGLAMVGEGADIIDVGGESTRPGAAPASPDEQMRRILPVVQALSQEDAVVSVDTSSAAVAREALDAGAAMVNDVTALRGDPDMASLVAQRGVPVALMHMAGAPMTMAVNPRYDDLMSEVTRFLRERVRCAVHAGIDEERTLVDPGIGFGKTAEHNLEILRRLAELRSIGRPILIGTSRKSFIGTALDLPVGERLFGTAATLALAVAAGASVVRVHDVREAVQVVRMVEAVIR